MEQKSYSHLRQRAEAQLLNFPQTRPPFPENDLRKLVHELQVHQIELEMQNQALLDAQHEITRHLEDFKDLYDLAPVAYFTLNRNGQITKANTLGKKLLDIPLSAKEGPRFSRFVSLDSLPAFAAFLSSVFNQRQLAFCYLQLACQQNEPPLFVFVEGIADETGDLCRLVVTDLTRQNESEKLIASLKSKTSELAVAKDAADAANRAKTSFLANMSHEIRTPMNAILGTAHLMRRGTLDDAQKKQLSTINTAANHLLGILNDILDLAKIDAEHLVLEHAEFNLNSLFENIRELLLNKLDAKSLNLYFSPEETLTVQTLCGDPLRVQQILLNLVSNAVKFTASGEIEVSAGIEEESAQDMLIRFAVRDTGTGIPADGLERIFMPFEQIDSSTTRKHGGTGLGLAICNRLVKLMGGEISVASRVGQGTTFTFTLRLAKNQRQPSTENRLSLLSTETAEVFLRTRCADKRVLLVEDDELNQDIACEILRSELGLNVELAGNGAQAIEMAEKTPYDLILMDVQMPVMDGLSATRAIRRISAHRKTPILAMTANTFADDRRLCIEAGMDEYIAKPFDPEILIVILAEKLGKS